MKSQYSDTITYTSGGSGYNTLRIASVSLYFVNEKAKQDSKLFVFS